ncbi:hypothetical protein JCM8097_004871 [Rhodosporidiobolus ruineniae]
MPTRSVLTTLLTTRRGVVLLCVAFGAVYLLVFSPSSSLTSGDADGLWESAVRKPAHDVAGQGALPLDRGAQWWAAPQAERVEGEDGKVRWYVAEEGTEKAATKKEDGDIDLAALGTEEGEGRKIDPGEAGIDDMFVQEGAELALQDDTVGEEDGEGERRHVDPVEQAERRPKRPSSGEDGLKKQHQAGADKNGDGLLSPDELDELDAEAEERRASSSLHTSHRSSDKGSSSSSADSSADESSSPLDSPESSSSSSTFEDDEDDLTLDLPEEDYDADWTSLPSSDAEQGSPDADFSPEEEADADAPSVAAKDDARMRAPMAALRPGAGAAREEDEDEAGSKHVKGAVVEPEKQVVEQKKPPQGKKVGTGGKLLAGGGADTDGAKAKAAPGRAKAEGQAKVEAGRRVGTGARPGAKLGGGAAARGGPARMKRLVRR